MKYLIIFLFIASIASTFIITKNIYNKSPEVKTFTKWIPIKDSSGAKTELKPKLAGEPKINVDSLVWWVNEYWKLKAHALDSLKDTSRILDNFNFVATKDTTYQDSLLSGSVMFVSRIPVDPEGFFLFDLKAKMIEKRLPYEVPVYREPWISHGIQAGFGYGLINNKFDLYIGYGVKIKLPF